MRIDASEQKAATCKRLRVLEGVRHLEAIIEDWPDRSIKLQDGDVFCDVVKSSTTIDLP